MDMKEIKTEEMEKVTGGSDDMDMATRNREIRSKLRELKRKGVLRNQAVEIVYAMYSSIATLEDIEAQANMIYGR